jgi:hypothetical protein
LLQVPGLFPASGASLSFSRRVQLSAAQTTGGCISAWATPPTPGRSRFTGPPGIKRRQAVGGGPYLHHHRRQRHCRRALRRRCPAKRIAQPPSQRPVLWDKTVPEQFNPDFTLMPRACRFRVPHCSRFRQTGRAGRIVSPSYLMHVLH